MADLISMMSAAAGLGGGEYEISRSLRFNSADSAYLNRTPASASNRKTWTWSGWVKRSAVTTTNGIFEAYDSGGAGFFLGFRTSTEDLAIAATAGVSPSWGTAAKFRDPSAWYHIVAVVDTTSATSTISNGATDRMRLYVNGVQQTLSGGTVPTQNADLQVNSTLPHHIGRFQTGGFYSDQYLTEINFIDGQALTPTSFGEFNTDTGVWQPIKYTGTYGTNGFYLDFSDNSGTTSTTLGKDSSGNGNNWTPNNFSVTAGAGNDSLVDSPTRYGTDTGAGGTVRGNYATWNPLRNAATLTNGNLDISGPANGVNSFATIGVASGKWYWEVTVTSVQNTFYPGIGVNTNLSLAPNSQSGADAAGYMYLASGTKFNNNTATAYGASFTTNDVIGVALDMDAGTITFYKNGSSQGQAFSGITGTAVPVVISWTNSTCVGNFGQRPFAHAAPSGFKALVTTNLPTPSIEKGGEYFNTVLWTGTGSGTTRAISGVGFQPDWVWAKVRSAAYSHTLYDVIRGGGANAELSSDSTNAEGAGNNDQYGYLSSFDSDGFTSTAGTQGAANNLYFNESGKTYVAWNWKANGAGVSNTAGTITSTVSVNTTSGFSIVTYTGNGSAGATIGHGLGVVPAMTIIKRRSNTETWIVWHTAFNSAQSNVRLQSTDAVDTNSPAMFNNTFPTSTLITLGNGNFVNTSAETYVCYAFAPVAGYSAFGSYTGNGSADGPFVYTGFRPKFIMRKQTTDNGDVGGWVMFDTSRDLFNVATKRLLAQSSNAEVTPGNDIDILSNGWKERSSDGYTNASGQTFIYMAFAENPFSIALAR
jgi:hypothetical protein